MTRGLDWTKDLAAPPACREQFARGGNFFPTTEQSIHVHADCNTGWNDDHDQRAIAESATSTEVMIMAPARYSRICNVDRGDDHEILLPDSPLRFSAMLLVSPKTGALCISLLISVTDLSTSGNFKIHEELGSISAVGREDFDFCKRLHLYVLLNALNKAKLYFIYWDTCSSYEMWQDPFTTIYKPRRLRGTPANKFVGLIACSVSATAVIVGLSIYFSFFGIRLKNKIENEGFLGLTEEDLIHRSMLHDNMLNRILSKAGQRPTDDRFA